MRTPTLTAIIPTPGQGRPLARCLRSIREQSLRPGDEVLVMGDTHDGPLPEVAALVASFGPQYRYHAIDAGGHDYGHSQLNAGMELAQGDYLTFNDDDDTYAPGAFARIRDAVRALEEPRPLLFRFCSYFGLTFWDEACRQPDGTYRPVEDHIGGHCAVFPNLPGRLGRWSARYQGDFDFIRSTLDRWPHGDAAAVWRPEVIAIARPGGSQ